MAIGHDLLPRNPVRAGRDPCPARAAPQCPKRELLKKTAPHLRTIYPAGRVWVLDCYDPAISQGYNPLAWVRDMRTTDLFARTRVKNTGTSGSEPCWDNAATTLSAAGELHLVRVAARDGGPPPLADLQDLLCNRGSR